MWLSLFATLTLRFNFILLKFAEQWLWNVCQPSLPAQPCPNASGSLCIAWGSPRGSVTVNLSNSSCPLSSHQASNLYNSNTVLGCLPSPLCITLSSVSEVMTQILPPNPLFTSVDLTVPWNLSPRALIRWIWNLSKGTQKALYSCPCFSAWDLPGT